MAFGLLAVELSGNALAAQLALFGRFLVMSASSPRCGTVTVRVADGLHLRPLTMISRVAQQFQSNVTLRRGNQVADAKRPLDLMTLAAGCGESLELATDGPDADAAFQSVVDLFENDFADDN